MSIDLGVNKSNIIYSTLVGSLTSPCNNTVKDAVGINKGDFYEVNQNVNIPCPRGRLFDRVKW